jgi:hypothetical protein
LRSDAKLYYIAEPQIHAVSLNGSVLGSSGWSELVVSIALLSDFASHASVSAKLKNYREAKESPEGKKINRTANVVTITPVDITTPAGVTAITAGLIATTPVKVFGVPQANGSIKAFVVFFYTGTAPGATS